MERTSVLARIKQFSFKLRSLLTPGEKLKIALAKSQKQFSNCIGELNPKIPYSIWIYMPVFCSGEKEKEIVRLQETLYSNKRELIIAIAPVPRQLFSRKMNKTVETITDAVNDIVIDVPLYENVVVTMVLLFAVFANGLLIFLFLRDHRMHTPTNFFVMSHIVSEFFASCLGFCISLHVLSKGGKAVFSPVACVAAGCVNVFFFHTSFLSLTAIAVNRYLAVVKKIHHKITATKAKTIICLIWMLSLVVSLPWAGWFVSLRPEKGSNFLSWLVYCPRSSSIFDQITSPAAILKIFLALLFIGVPICILLVCFYCILKSALRNRRRVSVSYNIHRVAADAYARSAFTTLLIIAVYLVCNAFMLPVIISPSTANSNPLLLYRCIIWLRSATYPLVYTLRNPVYFRLLRRKIILISRYVCQSCPCCFKDERASYARPHSPAPVNSGAISPGGGIVAVEMQQKLGRSRGFQGASSRETSPLPANQQIRAWYVYKPRMAFTDLGDVEGNGTQKTRPRNNEASQTDIRVPS